jgi:hypothetical protein
MECSWQMGQRKSSLSRVDGETRGISVVRDVISGVAMLSIADSCLGCLFWCWVIGVDSLSEVGGCD